MPEITASSQVDTDFIEDLLPPVVTDTDRHSMFIERSRRVMEMRWMTGRQDGSSHFDGRGSDNDGRDEDEDKDEDEDEDDPPFTTLEYQVFLLGTCLAKTLSVKLQH